MTERVMFTIKDATAAYSIGRTKLYELIGAGELNVIKIGKRTLLRRSDLEELLLRSAVA